MVGLPRQTELEAALLDCWRHDACNPSVGPRYEERPADGYVSPVGGFTALVYDIDIRDSARQSVLEAPSSWLWFDSASVGGITGRVAHLYVVEVLQDWRGNGIGTAYAEAKAELLPRFGVSVIHLDAAHEGPRFWVRRGFRFLNEGLFWSHWGEYCEFNDLEYHEDLDDIPQEYYDFLRETGETYAMYRVL